MKKNYTKLMISLAVLAASTNLAFADGNAFTPLNFDDSSYATPKSAPSTVAPKTNPVAEAFSKVMPKSTPAVETMPGEIPIGNDNIQNAILELDNAQVGIRNDLLNYRAKFADVDAQYKLIKNERNMLNKQVKTIERRIRNIDRAKEKIRKNML